MLTTLYVISLTIVLAVTDVFGRGCPVVSQPKDEGASKKRFAEALKIPARKAVEALIAIIERVDFRNKVIEFVAQYPWALIFFVARLIGV